MRRLIILTASLSVSLSGAAGVALAQEKSVEGIVTNADGANVHSTAGVNPTANGEGGTVIYGDITTGPGYTVIGPPDVVKTATAPVETTTTAAPIPVSESATTDPAPVTAEPMTVDSADVDGDNIADFREPELGLDPTIADTDSDAVADGDEINIYGTDPLERDSDGDGLIDGSELFDTHTDPLLWTDSSGTQTVALAQPVATEQKSPSGSTQLTQKAAPPVKDVMLPQQGANEILTATTGNASALGTGNAAASPGTITRNGVTVPSILGPDGNYTVTEISPPNVDLSGDGTIAEPVTEPAAEAAPVEEAPVEAAPVEAAPEEAVPVEAAPVEETAAETPSETAVSEPAAEATDLDGDNYPDAQEVELGLDPTNIDSDGDGVADGDELNIYATDPFTADSDGDGISDGGELYDTRTDPLVWTDFTVPATAPTTDQTVAAAATDQTVETTATDQTVEQETAVQDGM